MEEKEKPGTFKIDLSAPDQAEEKSSNIVHKTKPQTPKPPASAPQPTSAYIVLGFVAAAVIFIMGYFSLNKAINAINSSGSEQVKELNEKIATANKLIEDQKKGVGNDISGISTKIKNLESGLATVTKAEKTDKTELQSSLSEIKKEVDPLAKQIEELKQQIGKISSRAEEAAGSINKLESATQKYQKEMEKLSSSSVDESDLEAALKKERESTKQTINSLNNDIATLKKSIRDLEDRVNKKISSPATTAPSTGQTGVPKSRTGGIMEEEIK